MATSNRPARPAQLHAAFAQYLPLEKTFRDAAKLVERLRNAGGFREYVSRRAAFVVPAVALFFLVSIACSAALVILFAERHALLALPGMVLAPFVLLGSFFVQSFVFLSWLEGRALAQALGRRADTPLDFGAMPRVPWALAALFLGLPLLVLAAVSLTAALVLILLAVLITVAIARFDR